MANTSDIAGGRQWSSTTIYVTYDDSFLSTYTSLKTGDTSNENDGDTSQGALALSAWAAIAPFDFRPASSAATANIAILEANVVDHDGVTNWNTSGNSITAAATFQEPNSPLWLFIHELGHALGLDHPGHGASGIVSGFTQAMTIMTYRRTNEC